MHPLWSPQRPITARCAAPSDRPQAQASVLTRRLTSAVAAIDHQHLVVESAACPRSTAEGSDSRDSSCGSARVVWPPAREPSSAVLPSEADTQRAFRVSVIARSSPAHSDGAAHAWSSAPAPELSEHRAGRQVADFPDQDAPRKTRLPLGSPSGGDVAPSKGEHTTQTSQPEGGSQPAAAAVSLAGPSVADVVQTEQAEPSRPSQQHLSPAAWSESSPVQRPAQPPELTATPGIIAPASAKLPDAASPQRLRSPIAEAARPAMHAAEANASQGTGSVQPPLQDPTASAVQDPIARPASTSDARPADTQLRSPAAGQGSRAALSGSACAGDSVIAQASPSRPREM